MVIAALNPSTGFTNPQPCDGFGTSPDRKPTLEHGRCLDRPNGSPGSPLNTSQYVNPKRPSGATCRFHDVIFPSQT